MNDPPLTREMVLLTLALHGSQNQGMVVKEERSERVSSTPSSSGMP